MSVLSSSTGSAAYWSRVVQSASSDGRLPPDLSDGSADGQRGAFSVRVPRSALRALRERAREGQVSHAVVAVAALEILSVRYTREAGVYHGVQLGNGRNGAKLELVSMIEARSIANEQTLGELVAAIARSLEQGRAHTDVLASHIATGHGLPLALALGWVEGDDQTAAPECFHRDEPSRGELALFCVDRTHELELHADFDAARFSEGRIRALVEQFLGLLDTGLASLAEPVSVIRLQSASDRLRPDPSLPLAGPVGAERVFDAFLEHARERPDALAIAHSSRNFSYGELETASRLLATRLLCAEARDGVVAIYGKRRPELVVSMLACLRAGLTFAVVDAAYPAARITQLVDVIRPSRILVIEPTREDEAVLAELRDGKHAVLEVRKTDFECPEQRTELPRGRELDVVAANAIAYLLFTSGTTGVPKCVEASHQPLVHFVNWYRPTFDVEATSRFSVLSGLGHDPVLRDIFVPLSAGASLHIPEQAALLQPPLIAEWLVAERVTHVHATPQLAKIVCTGAMLGAPLDSLRFVLLGGDSLKGELLRELSASAPRALVVNFYGTTETPQAMGYHVTNGAESREIVPLGKGIEDVQLLVVDDELTQVGIGELGQIAIRTKFLASGYLHDSELTRRKFAHNPSSGDPADLLYLTGDYGFIRYDGAVVLRGRIDDQVKIRGYRVELAEVVRTLERDARVSSALVLPERMPNGENRLVGYLVRREGAQPEHDDVNTDHVKAALATSLPSYMVPARFVWLERMPLLPNGKLDRSRLLSSSAREGEALQPENELERTLIASWSALLGVRAVGPRSTFVNLGGDSLSFIQASAQLERILGWLPDGWEKTTIRELSTKERSEQKWTTTMSTSVLVRAVSIVLVVCGHAGIVDLPGSTDALFVIAGLSFGTYQLKSVLQSDRIAPVFRTLFKIALPTVLYLFLLQLRYTSPKWESLLLISNFFGTRFDGGFTYWFIEVLVQCQLVLAGLLSVRALREQARTNAFRFGLVGVLVCFALYVVVPQFWNTMPLLDRVPHMKLYYLFLGWLLAYADDVSRKAQVLMVSVVALFIPLFEGLGFGWYAVLAVLLVLRWPRVVLPRLLGRVAAVCASASLFIYLTHAQGFALLHKLPLHLNPYVELVLTVAIGAAAWKLWDVGYAAVGRSFRSVFSGDFSLTSARSRDRLLRSR